MKIPWKGLGILIVLLTAIFYDIPTLMVFLPEDEQASRERMELELQQANDLYEPFKKIGIAIVTEDRLAIQLVVEEDFEFPIGNGIFDAILSDNFSYDESNSGHFIRIREDADEDVFVTDVSNRINGIVKNAKKIESIQLDESRQALLFNVKRGKRLSLLVDPVKTILGDTMDLAYQEDRSRYISRPKVDSKVVNLGLDLQGGMYLDIGIKTEEIFTSVMDRLAEDIEDLFIEDNVNYDTVERIGARKIEILFEADESIELTGDGYKRLLEQNFDVVKKTQGYEIELTADEQKRIETKSLQLALEVIRNRIDQLGVKEPSVQQQGDNSIIVQLPGLQDPEQARRVIAKAASLKFMLVAEEGSIDNPDRDQIVLQHEERDPVTKELLSSRPVLLEKKTLLTGKQVRDSRVQFSQTGTPSVGLVFDSEGKEIFSQLTKSSIGRQLAIVLDGIVYSSPVIRSHIPNGEAEITGSFPTEEASELAMVLRSGALPAPIFIHEERTVGASLGEDSVRQSIVAFCVGFALVILFMLVYYEVSGIFSILALIFNILLIVAALAYFGATLTLPGMAGIILTIGMAVDANVLIFERIREEIGRKTPIRTAIHNGFQKATITILDSNITTILAAIVLFQFGTGPIRGFSVTLSIGIAASMFTSIVVGRYLFYLVYLRRKRLDRLSI